MSGVIVVLGAGVVFLSKALLAFRKEVQNLPPRQSEGLSRRVCPAQGECKTHRHESWKPKPSQDVGGQASCHFTRGCDAAGSSASRATGANQPCKGQ